MSFTNRIVSNETVNIRVLDYYNRPGYYPYMPNELFSILEQAFLDDKEFVNVPKHLFDTMMNVLTPNPN